MAELKEVDASLVLQLKDKLISPETDITERWATLSMHMTYIHATANYEHICRYRVLFSMRNIKGEVAHDALVECKDYMLLHSPTRLHYIVIAVDADNWI